MDQLDKLFAAQLELIHKIGGVYTANGFDAWTRAPVLENRVHQAHVKYVAWCFHEEICEVSLHEDEAGRHEEIVDAFHFLLELMIFCGMTPQSLFDETMKSIGTSHSEPLDRLDYMFFMTMANPQLTGIGAELGLARSLGYAMYELKQKPWRVTDKPTDQEELRRSLGVLFHAFIRYAHSQGMTARGLWLGYIAKNDVNHKRVQEKY